MSTPTATTEPPWGWGQIRLSKAEQEIFWAQVERINVQTELIIDEMRKLGVPALAPKEE